MLVLVSYALELSRKAENLIFGFLVCSLFFSTSRSGSATSSPPAALWLYSFLFIYSRQLIKTKKSLSARTTAPTAVVVLWVKYGTPRHYVRGAMFGFFVRQRLKVKTGQGIEAIVLSVESCSTWSSTHQVLQVFLTRRTYLSKYVSQRYS